LTDKNLTGKTLAAAAAANFSSWLKAGFATDGPGQQLNGGALLPPFPKPHLPANSCQWPSNSHQLPKPSCKPAAFKRLEQIEASPGNSSHKNY
jgi:hypothetical protein